MFNTNNSSTNVFGVSLKARSLSHVVAETEVNRFLVGTVALKEENEVCLLEYRENEGVKCLSTLQHPQGEIWSITSCPYDADLFFSVYNTGTSNEFKSSLWRINYEQQTITEQYELKDTTTPHQGMIKPVLCDPSGSKDYCITLDDQNIRVWSNLDSKQPTVQRNFGNLTKLSVGCINPNVSSQLSTANDNNIRIWDFKNGIETHTIEKAHSGYIRDIDFNPNKQYYLLSAGDDGKLKVWDTRQTKEPVKIFAGHNHWIWNAKFNKYHDQLIITSSSDNTVKLWNLYSLSSAFSSTNDENDPNQENSAKPVKKNKRNEDQLIKTYEEHEDSVYNVSWSTSNFLFASLSYDGRLVINNVPKEYSDILSYI